MANPLEFDERFIIGEVNGTWRSGQPRLTFWRMGAGLLDFGTLAEAQRWVRENRQRFQGTRIAIIRQAKVWFNQACKEDGCRWGHGLSEPTLQPLS